MKREERREGGRGKRETPARVEKYQKAGISPQTAAWTDKTPTDKKKKKKGFTHNQNFLGHVSARVAFPLFQVDSLYSFNDIIGVAGPMETKARVGGLYMGKEYFPVGSWLIQDKPRPLRLQTPTYRYDDD